MVSWLFLPGCFCLVHRTWRCSRRASPPTTPSSSWRRMVTTRRSWWELEAWDGFILVLPTLYFGASMRLVYPHLLQLCLIDSTSAAADDTFLSWEYRMRDLCWVVRSLPTTTQQSQWVEVSRKQKTLLRKQKNTVNTCTTVTKVVTHMQLSWRVGLMSTFNSVQDTPTLDLYRHDSAQQWQMLFFFLLGPSKDTLARWPNPLFGGRWRWHTTNASFKLWQLLH